MCENPLLNEPGITVKHPDMSKYNRIIEYKNIEFEDLDQSDAFLLGLCYFIDKKIIKGVWDA